VQAVRVPEAAGDHIPACENPIQSVQAVAVAVATIDLVLGETKGDEPEFWVILYVFENDQ